MRTLLKNIVKKYYISTLCICMVQIACLSGCATMNKELGKIGLKLERYQLDFSKSNNPGLLILYCNPPSQQLLIGNYILKIDDNEPIRLFKYSISEIKIDPGTHDIELYSISEGMQFLYGESFGKKTKEKVSIAAGEKAAYEYVGSFICFSKGSFTKLKSTDKME